VKRLTVVTVLVALVVVVTACSGSGTSTPSLAPGTTPPPVSAPTTSSVPTSPSVTSATTAPSVVGSTTSEVPAVSIPIPETEGETDFADIWRELIEYHNWAFQNPELADVDIYMSEDCECYANAVAILEEYRANGWRETSPGYTVQSVSVDLSTSTVALMTVVDEHSPLVVVDAAGNVVREKERRPKTFYDVRVRLTEAGWRIVEWFQRGAIGDAE